MRMPLDHFEVCLDLTKRRSLAQTESLVYLKSIVAVRFDPAKSIAPATKVPSQA